MTDALTAATLVQRGVAHWAARFDDVGGAVPNSVYYGLPELLAREDHLAWRFTRALHQAMKWVQEHPADDVASLLQTHWPEADQAVLTDVINGFRHTGLWADSVLVSKPAYERWHNMLALGGLLSAHVDYVDLVDVGPAQDALTSATTNVGCSVGVESGTTTT
jgi:NitT/TauT family transport system substrate-binding protein